ncbi:sensor histidine kinase [Thermomonospora umbrina]|uniref:histidine kinase n=1 Tax=Thermomonospora umbrina TaxID=111806 RepID=A0A3D9SSB1_9ACTN|nr:nitrate- and nitrite sensing domain-containing protein [Thermomonospora umbrina]REE98856.1 signal transduction histidine kinase [Thermomonospora umbrina]
MTPRTPPVRTQSIRTKIVVLLVIPLVSLVGLWVFATLVTFGEARELLDARKFDRRLVRPTQTLVTALQHERRMSMAFLGDPALDRSGLDAQRVKTDEARRHYRTNVTSGTVRARVDRITLDRLDTAAGRLGQVDAIRRLIDQRSLRRDQVVNDYSGLIRDLSDPFRAVTFGNGEIAKDLQNVAALTQVRELLSRQDALVTGALTAGRWRVPEQLELYRLGGAAEFLLADLVPGLPATDRARYEVFATGPDLVRYQRLQQRLAGADHTDRRPPVDLGSWHTASEAVIARMAELEVAVAERATERSDDVATASVARLAAAGGLGLLAVLVSAVVAVRIARRLVGESRLMADTVGDFTENYIPALADVVRDGGTIDADSALPRQRLQVTEIARINEAFLAAGRAVIEAATRESETWRGINEVFVTLARRNQALVHRQLTLLDTMERRTEDPEELDDLFRLDHMATRMRRHAEGLVILAGRPAGRTWRTPVPLVDVVRGAVAEVEDYTRVGVLSMPAAALAGNAVADTIHLLAELIENATLFSPPQSPVRITGQVVPNGFVVEIEDRGLGLKQETLDELNRRLVDTPGFDLSDLGRLGLFVVARLAARHGIKVSLRASPYGGTTAIVLVPAGLVVESPAGGTPPAEMRAQLPGPSPRTVPAEVQAPAGRTLVASPRAVPEPVAAPRAVRDERPDVVVPAELPRRRRAQDPPTGPNPIVNGAAPVAVEAAEVGETPESPETVDKPVELTEDGLPRRRRQGSLASGLQADGADGTDGADGAGREDDPEGRIEDLRTKMAAMQRGWRRGRAEADDGQGTQEDGQ